VVACLLACTGAETSDAGKQAAPVQPGKARAPAEPAGDELPGAEQLLDESVAAMGGAEKFDALSELLRRVDADMGSLGSEGRGEGLVASRRDFYNETEMPGIGQMKIGRRPTRCGATTRSTGCARCPARRPSRRCWSATLCLAPVWREYFKTARRTAVTAGPDGKQLAEIELVSMLGDKVVLRIDVASKMPVSQTLHAGQPARGHADDRAASRTGARSTGSRCRSASSSTRRR
jgi:hypothetical protein